MKLQCELCREIVAADFRIEGDGIEVRCPACQKSFTVAATREAAAAEPPRPSGDLTCPKCGDTQPPAPACRTCGLLAERMASFERDRDASVPATVTEAWQAVESSWDDGAAHDRFLDEVTGALAYAWGAQRYRAALRLHPGDARATEALARLTRMAEATLLAGATRKVPAAPVPYRNVVILLVALVVLIGVGVTYALVATSTREEPPGASHPTTPRKKPKKDKAAPATR